jgi:hypothetical protein
VPKCARPRIQLVVTGDLEMCLPEVLARIFPEAVFLPAQRAHAFTTAAIPAVTSLKPDTTLPDALRGYELLSRMLAAIDPGIHGVPADFAIALDDVEVTNRDNEAAILNYVRFLVGQLIKHGPHDRRGNPLSSTRPDEPDVGLVRPLKTPERRRCALQKRCSFHLLAPMIEAPFFGDSTSIGPEAAARSKFDSSQNDFEDFQTDDPAFVSPPDDWIPAGGTYAAPWARPDRQFHPKRYLEFLLDPTGFEQRPYREKVHGKSFLDALRWDTVFSIPTHGTLLRSLIDDIADMCATHRPPWAVGHLNQLTCLQKDGILRNVALR